MIDAILHNWRWKLLSLVVAFILWAAFVEEKEQVTFLSVPVEFKNVPANLELAANVPERVRLEVRGPSYKLADPSLSQTSVVLDLNSVRTPGERTFLLNRGTTNLPDGVVLTRAIPSQIHLRFENRVQRSVPVVVRTTGELPPGRRLAAQEVRPERLEVVGPETRVAQVESVATDPIPLTELTESKTVQVPVFLSDPQVRFTTSPIVEVRLALEKTGVKGSP
jgi:hypothetical protein